MFQSVITRRREVARRVCNYIRKINKIPKRDAARHVSTKRRYNKMN